MTPKVGGEGSEKRNKHGAHTTKKRKWRTKLGGGCGGEVGHKRGGAPGGNGVLTECTFWQARKGGGKIRTKMKNTLDRNVQAAGRTGEKVATRIEGGGGGGGGGACSGSTMK